MKNSFIDTKDIIKYKGFIGDFYLNKDISNVVIGRFKGRYFFDSLKQLRYLIKVFFLINYLQESKKPILFFGLNKKRINSFDHLQVSRINKEIFDLCFCFNNKKDKALNQFINDFYLNFYQNDKPLVDGLQISKYFHIFDKNLEKFEQSGRLSIKGYFFDSWEGSYFSNYHVLKARLNFCLKKLFVETKNKRKVEGMALNEDLNASFLEQFRNFFFLTKCFEKKENFPGAAFFFSKEGYEDLFIELKKSGVPVVCIVNTSDSLKNIDYPLFGNSLYFDIIIFYQKLIKKLLGLNKKK